MLQRWLLAFVTFMKSAVGPQPCSCLRARPLNFGSGARHKGLRREIHG